MIEMANKILDWQENKQGDQVIVNFSIPKKYIDMIDELACLETDGNRTLMLIKLIEKQYKIKKDLQQWKNDDAIRREMK